ncbi:hypothetical protein NM208_g14458 [Fusarium decemcellulare]|uniref:Uncharacterized protein n=1 Tax=Fusarium decemcellulare TaxID=57161 RepID=A0ACC1RG12_9HYPO|nr:hypothetical protein NM208_g14458 [Fusarium decemcellulare]
MSATKKLVVCGGTGFLGSRICKYAVARGWDVTSISRSGDPRWDTITSSPSPPPWAHKVSWERGDILRPATYAPLLNGADFVVHSMGILLEADYKGVISGKESPISGLQKAFAPVRDRGFSYEIMNRDSAVTLAKHAVAAKVSSLCYISAAGGAPVLPQRYIATKREAEITIANKFPQLRGVFIRPSFMFDSSRPVTMPLAAMVGLGTAFNGLTGNYFKIFMGAAGVKPLKVETVAEAVVEALSDESVKGALEVNEIEELANKAWRKTML